MWYPQQPNKRNTKAKRNRAIFMKVKAGAKQVDVAREYGLSQNRVSEICMREARS